MRSRGRFGTSLMARISPSTTSSAGAIEPKLLFSDPGIQGFHFLLDGGHQQLVPAREVAIEGGARHTGPGGDLLHAGGGDSVGQVAVLGGSENGMHRIGFVTRSWASGALARTGS